MRTLSLVLLVASLAGCSQVQTFADDVMDDRAGGPGIAWDSSYGEMLFDPLREGDLDATYYEGDGILTGTLQGRTYSGVWYHPEANRSCPTERHGTPDWGRFEFRLNASMTAFEGTWSFCDAALTRDWDGTKK